MIKQGDCLELMKEIPPGSVDLILTDLPFGITSCSFDKRIPFEPLWREFHRVAKENAAILLFAASKFLIELAASNLKYYRYKIVWEKLIAVGFYNANKMPLRAHEDILVFYKKLPTYNPQFTKGEAYHRNHSTIRQSVYQKTERIPTKNDGKRFPRDVQKFATMYGKRRLFHPTEKPVALLEYLIKTYTNEGELVLDATMGSGSTGVACVNTNRRFIGFELEKEFFDIAQKRIDEALAKKQQELF